jgi:hypothetical protein
LFIVFTASEHLAENHARRRSRVRLYKRSAESSFARVVYP